ncbi:ABC transporter ATP-binding protein [Solirubrobacter ginsenosidimutans]|uniref:ABC transporter ATP-binding protein n=1 Tax=Solirubrobacter ginsenosidimutans TaxID=490573 RepID=A0A9X3MZD4_9ACTN|nr:ABC transporter ATP-binding protein [Solirubrobacter ginsenosidimutans]MDA0163972.1 ABC transporter ATP-binding protein [Solirubrobacter ginsenosidimutans]
MLSPAIHVTGLRVQRGGRAVLDGFDFSIERGTICGLLGSSGCGKTTLIRSIVGVQRLAAGSVTVLGEPAGSPGLRSRVAYVTQAPSVYSDLSVAANLRYFAAVLGVPAWREDDALEAVGLADRRRDVVGTLSGGQRGRVSLACALLSEPELLVLDEPTVGLDPVLRRDLWNLFHDLAAAGTTLLVSSHVMDEAERCDRLLLMRDGGLLADDTPSNLLARTRARDLETAFLRMIEPLAVAA